MLVAHTFVAVDGNDANPGTFDKPFRSIAKAVSVLAPGDTVYVRGGSYLLTSTVTIGSAQSGSADGRNGLFAYPGERPLLDFTKTSGGTRGISLRASYWHIKGFDIKGAGDNGMEISVGSHNIVEWCSFFENGDSGLQLSNGASDNRIIDCDSYENADPPDYGDADGFAPKLTVGSGNTFYGCRSWGNCDDGWDGYLRGANNVTTTLENCWTWGNGYLKNGTDPGPQANGNGFKMGGGDDSNSQQLMHHFILKQCLAFRNKVKGFDQNNNVGSMTLLNCTAYGNKGPNYRITRTLNAGQTLTVKNCLSFEGSVELGTFAVQEKNSWMPPFAVTVYDFLSIDPSSASAPRKTDGSLPDIAFMHPAPGSALVDAGVELGLPFSGKAPDLGAFESDATTVVRKKDRIPAGFRLFQNHPNPFNPQTVIQYTLGQPGIVVVKVYSLAGREMEILVDAFQVAGDYRVQWKPRGLATGTYLCRLQIGASSETRKLILQK